MWHNSSAWSKERASRPESTAELGLTSSVPCWGWSQGRTPMATMAVRCCFRDAKEWLASWIRIVFSDSARGDSATPGRRDSGRMWNVTEQGHSKGHHKTCHPSPHRHWGIYSPGLVQHMKKIVPEFILCFLTDLGLCLPLHVVTANLQTTGEDVQAKTAWTPFHSIMLLF